MPVVSRVALSGEFRSVEGGQCERVDKCVFRCGRDG